MTEKHQNINIRVNPNQKKNIKEKEAEASRRLIYCPENCSYPHCVWLINKKI